MKTSFVQKGIFDSVHQRICADYALSEVESTSIYINIYFPHFKFKAAENTKGCYLAQLTELKWSGTVGGDIKKLFVWRRRDLFATAWTNWAIFILWKIQKPPLRLSDASNYVAFHICFIIWGATPHRLAPELNGHNSFCLGRRSRLIYLQ